MNKIILTLLLVTHVALTVAQFKAPVKTFKKDNKYGIKDANGKTISEAKYDKIELHEVDGITGNKLNDGFGYAFVELNDKVGLLNNKSGKVLIEPKFDMIDFFSNHVSRFRLNGKEGVLNDRGEVVVKPVYDLVVYSSCTNGELQMNLVHDNGANLYAVFGKDGNQINKKLYNEVHCFSENGLATVRLNEEYGWNYGFINRTGSVVIPLNYNYAYSFHNGMAVVCKDGEFGSTAEANGYFDGKWGYINEEGEEIAVQYNNAVPFLGDISAVYIDEPGHGMAGSKEQLEAMRKEFNKMWGWFRIDRKGRLLDKEPFAHKIDTRSQYNYRLYSINDGSIEKYGFIGLNCEIVVKAKYDNINADVDDPIAAVKLNDKWAYMSTTSGKLLTDFIFEEARTFTPNGLARAKKEGKWGFIDLECKEVIPFKYNSVEPFEYGKSAVTIEGREFYIDEKGNEIK